MNPDNSIFSGYSPVRKDLPAVSLLYPSANPARLGRGLPDHGDIICTLVESILFSDGEGI